ncbi:MAG: protein kinase [Gemmatimonadetes bacterium]|nr:protein kinase [Gemmatimonadota bacterium]
MPDFDALRQELSSLYTLQAERGRDALGITFSGTAADGRAALVRVLGADVSADLSAPDEFVRVFEAAARVSHPALVPILGAGVTPTGRIYSATLRPDGRSGAERAAARETLAAGDIGAVGAALADALTQLHAHDLVHGAITASQVFLGSESPVLANAGLLQALVAGGLETRRAATMLAPATALAPEMLGGQRATPGADVYGLGAALYEMHTGKPPFGGRTTAFVMASVLGDESASVSETGSQHPGQVVEALLRAIEKSPDDRWRSADAFAKALAPEVARGSAPGRAWTDVFKSLYSRMLNRD